ncbi:MAG TPA: NUDIX domain-containing protein [Pyrinomonadaceae bacterium]|nr:NUDIX domain-containing protein [Pyrinomonadaceae bacterium]
MRTIEQVSAGGVAFRREGGRTEVALIRVGAARPRWQLPKGIVDAGEALESAAVREVREEAGVETGLVAHVETIEYWYVSTERGERVRFHKFVHFYLLRYLAGDTRDHDHEVLEARFFPAEEAARVLAFASERGVVARARAMIDALGV